MNAVLQLLTDRRDEILLRTGEHLVLTGASTLTAIAIGIPLGILAFRVLRSRRIVLGLTSILQTVPSLAMLAILLAATGQIGKTPAIIALTLYALLPVVRNTVTGLCGVAPEINEAGRGIGMTPRQLLLLVQLPLAAPTIVAGIRTAAVIGVGIATLAAFIGAGGLGEFINRGLALNNTPLILLGAIPAALLALIVDGVLGLAGWGLQPTPSTQRGRGVARFKPLALASPLLLVIAGIALALYPAGANHVSGNSKKTNTIHIAAKNFTEQFILAEMIAQLVEENTDLRVERHFNLGGTMICHQALTAGAVDLYVEYTGTALTAILQEPAVTDADVAYQQVAAAYREQFDVVWLEPFGFNNTYTITIRSADATDNNRQTISDLVPGAGKLNAGFTSEFIERNDGLPGLREAYGLAFAKVADMDPALMYQAIRQKQVDVICAFATDGRIVAYDLRTLEDDKHFFPPYDAVPIIRRDTLERHPELRNLLNRLGGIIDTEAMRRLNLQVDEQQKPAATVARAFLRTNGLIPE